MTTQKLWTNALNNISVAMLVITQRNSFTSSIIIISGQYNDYSTILIFLFMILYGSLPQWLTSSKLCLSPDAQGFRMQATGILKNLSVTLMLKQEWGKKTPYPKNISNMLGTSLETWWVAGHTQNIPNIFQGLLGRFWSRFYRCPRQILEMFQDNNQFMSQSLFKWLYDT